MLRRSLLVSAVLLAGSFGFANSAKAVDGTVDVPFTILVPSSCSFTAISPNTGGTLVLSGANDKLDSKASGGISPTVSLDCGGKGATVSVQTPVEAPVSPLLANPTPATSTLGMISVAGKNTDSSKTPITLTATEATNATVTVDMTASISNGSFAIGNYGYTVKIIASPGV